MDVRIYLVCYSIFIYLIFRELNVISGHRGSRSSLHYDPYQNLLCCVRGAKRVVLHAPGQAARLYARPLHGEAPNHSAVDFAQPDLEQHPLYPLALAECLVADLHVPPPPPPLPPSPLSPRARFR